MACFNLMEGRETELYLVIFHLNMYFNKVNLLHPLDSALVVPHQNVRQAAVRPASSVSIKMT